MKLYQSFAALVLGLAVIGCAKESDVDDLKGRVDALETKVSALDKALTDLKADVGAIQLITDAIKAKGFVRSVEKNDVGVLVTIYKDGKEETVSIQIDGKQGEKGDKGNPGQKGDTGEKGADGHSPVISVVEEGGVLYWAVDGKVLEVGGQKVAVYAATPQFKLENGHLYVSTDGQKWDDLGDLNPDYQKPAFTDVDVQDDKVVFTVNGGSTFELPLEKAFGLQFASREVIADPSNGGKTVSINYTVVAATEETEVDVLAATAGYAAEVKATDHTAGVVEVTYPSPLVSGYVLVWADNLKGKTSLKKLTFSAEDPVFEVSEVS